MSDTYERIATDAIQILFMLSLNESKREDIHRAADTLATRLETLGRVNR